VATTEEEAQSVCLPDEQAVRVAAVAVALEKALFDGVTAADVEFAVGGGQDAAASLYLLQVYFRNLLLYLLWICCLQRCL
jgi:hypothetical protein